MTVLDPTPDDDDSIVEGALRPTTLTEFVGQDRVKNQLGLVLEAARRRSGVSDHVLIFENALRRGRFDVVEGDGV